LRPYKPTQSTFYFFTSHLIFFKKKIMKLSNITKSLLALVATLAASNAFAADFSVTIPEARVVKGATAEVPVYFNSAKEITGLQIDIRIPEALAGVLDFATDKVDANNYVAWNTARFTDTRASSLNSSITTSYKGEYKVVTATVTNSRTEGGILPSSKVDSDFLFNLRLKIKDGAEVEDAILGSDYSFIDAVVISVDASAKEVYKVGLTADAVSTDNVTIGKTEVRTLSQAESHGTMSFGAESYTIAAGTTGVIALNYDSDFDAHMVQFDVALPAGLSIVADGETFASRTNSLNFGGFTALTSKERTYRVIFDTTDLNASIAKGTGEFMTFKVAAAADFEGGSIALSTVRASAVDAKFTVNQDGPVSVLVTNGLADAKALADAEVKALTDSLAAAKEAVPGQYANNQGVKDAIAAAEAAVKAVSDAVDAAAANNTLAANYDAVLAGKDGAAEAVAAIATAVAAAEKAAETQIDNEQKIQADEKTLADLLDALAAAKEEAGANGDDEAAEAIAKQIADLQESVKQAAADAQDGSGEAYIPMGDVIEEELAQKIEDYKADAAATASLRAANQTAYDAELASIADVEETYQAALSKIASDYPNADVADAKKAVEDAIAAAKAAAAEALTTANDSKEAYSHHFNAGPINVLITDLLNKAAADGVAIISVDAAVEGAIYTIDGVRHANPVQGKINIIRTKDSTKKVFVK
jgi:hypothetical protein